jgi:ribosomal-protein-alanine N-acetyltransferase
VPAIRLLSLDDVPALVALAQRNRDFLAPWQPAQPPGHDTEAAQRAAVLRALDAHQRGLSVPHVILDRDGAVAGRITLSDIVRGSFQSCHLGYWVSEDRTGAGLATAAVAAIARLAFGELELHRIQAATLLHNAASQRVLEHNGFLRIGVAPGYLQIAGHWQDHVLFQLLAPGSS